MSLLLKVKPLVISPVLAQRIGLNEAIVLQQICYWLEETESGVEHDGKRWIYNTIEGWAEQFPFWSQDTIKRALTSLKKRGLIYVEQLKKSQHDRTNFYSINHQNPLLTDEGNLHSSKGAVCPVRKMQAAPVHQSSLHSSIRANCPDLTEITTENTTENKTPSCPDASPPDDSPVENPDEFLARYPDAVVYSAKKRHWGSHEDLKCAEWIWGQITRLYEQAAETDGELAKPREPNWAAWANDVRLMCSQDQRTHRQICQLFRRVQGDPFWCRNILSPAKLREKWDELVVRLGPVQRSVTDISPVDYAIPEGFRGY